MRAKGLKHLRPLDDWSRARLKYWVQRGCPIEMLAAIGGLSVVDLQAATAGAPLAPELRERALCASDAIVMLDSEGREMHPPVPRLRLVGGKP